MKKKATLRDIANICGCSVTSVSRALKDSPTISAAMRAKIRQTANELGYIQNSAATSMRTGYSNTIAVCLQDFCNPYYATLASYIESYARSLGYSVLFSTANEHGQQEYDVCKSLIEKNVDGILFFPTDQDTKAIVLLQEQQIPFVTVGRRFYDIDTDYVVPDDERGAHLATEHLIEKGAEKILFLNVSSSISSARERLLGYRKAIQEHRLEEHVIEGSMQFGHTRELIRRMHSSVRKYDAIFTFCDIIGFEAYHTLRGMGIHIPREIKLISIDGLQEDVPLPVHLTSIGIDRRAMAQQATDLLLRRISDQTDSPAEHITINTYLIPGDTT